MRFKLKAWAGVFAIAALAGCSETSETEHTSVSAPAEQSSVAASSDVSQSTEDTRPNILLILADDLGYTDLGVYGGEIETPNIDQLAREGLILTDFHNQAVCAPTRAAILSGTDNHNAGGAMHQRPDQIGVPGYESNLNHDVVAFSESLQAAGYSTTFAGKWHLGREADQTPDARGFDNSFALMEGGASHYSDMRGMFAHAREANYRENGEVVEQLPDDFYSSDFYTDYVIKGVDSAGDKPWFAYLAFTAPHWPLQAPENLVEKYEGVYDEGYEVLRENRIERGKALGVIPEDAVAHPLPERVPAWDSLSEEEQIRSAHTMEIFAGMVDSIDHNVGRVIEHLKQTGEYENTLILFLADNGAEGSARNPGDNGTDWVFDNSLENMGKMGSHIYYGPGWAMAGVGVSRYYKSYASEGGTHGPAIMHHPQLSKAGEINDAFVSVVDLAPTFLELADANPIQVNAKGEPALPMTGVSLVPLLFDEADSVRPDDFTFGWDVFGHRGLRKGDWKLLYLTSTPSERAQPLAEGADRWGLYNIADDPGETQDLSAQYPELVQELLADWDDYVDEFGVVPIAAP